MISGITSADLQRSASNKLEEPKEVNLLSSEEAEPEEEEAGSEEEEAEPAEDKTREQVTELIIT